jgi:hypothetical protein
MEPEPFQPLRIERRAGLFVTIPFHAP